MTLLPTRSGLNKRASRRRRLLTAGGGFVGLLAAPLAALAAVSDHSLSVRLVVIDGVWLLLVQAIAAAGVIRWLVDLASENIRAYTDGKAWLPTIKPVALGLGALLAGGLVLIGYWFLGGVLAGGALWALADQLSRGSGVQWPLSGWKRVWILAFGGCLAIFGIGLGVFEWQDLRLAAVGQSLDVARFFWPLGQWLAGGLFATVLVRSLRRVEGFAVNEQVGVNGRVKAGTKGAQHHA